VPHKSALVGCRLTLRICAGPTMYL